MSTRHLHTAVTPAGERRGLSGSSLKILAMVSMLIDHSAVAFLEKGLLADFFALNVQEAGAMAEALAGIPYGETLYAVYNGMRMLGRLAFPIFCFLIAEGFSHTRNPKRYLGSLFLFALISEIPFDLVFSGRPLEFDYQNIFWTLTIGVAVLYAYESIQARSLHSMLCLLPVLAGMGLAELLATDYGAYGVAFITALYLLRQDRRTQTIFGILFGLLQVTAVLAFLPLWFYNGRRGLSLKWAFYVFYPGHLLLLYGLQQLL